MAGELPTRTRSGRVLNTELLEEAAARFEQGARYRSAHARTHQRLRELARTSGEPVGTVVERAVEAFRRDQLLLGL